MSKRARKLLTTALVVVVGSYLAICILARLLYPKILFPAPKLDAVPASFEARAREALGPKLLTLAGGTRAIWYAPEHAEDRVAVVFHGNGETMFDHVPTGEWLRSRGFGALLVEYRGYGLSYGASPSEASLYEDGEAAMKWLADEKIDDRRVVLWGTSLGTGIAGEMAARGHGSRLVLVSPFTSITDIGRRLFKWLPVSLLLAHRLDTLSKAERIKVPTLVIHGDLDEVVPVDMGEKVARAIGGATLVVVNGGHHNDLFSGGAGHSPSGEQLLARIEGHLSGR